MDITKRINKQKKERHISQNIRLKSQTLKTKKKNNRLSIIEIDHNMTMSRKKIIQKKIKVSKKKFTKLIIKKKFKKIDH